MEGIAERDRRALERQLSLAWHIGMFNGSKLKPFSHYLAQIRPQQRQSGEAILAVFREYQSRGAPIRFTKLEPHEVN